MKKISPFLAHILESISKIEKFTSGYEYTTFESDEKTHEAVIRQIEVIGEAITHMEHDFRSKYPQIPWTSIIGMRNHLIHEYWDINLEDVWQTVIEDIPKLKTQINVIFSNLP
jgi:uncharacterized protein with HEPN domain